MELQADWCHCTATTYGAWLSGDPRGFRTRRHREHVEGDYKRPPAADYSERHAAARERMRRKMVVLSPEAQWVVLEAVRYALVDVHGLEVVIVAVAATHLHVLARFPAAQKPTPSRRGLRATDLVRFHVGVAKERSAKVLIAAGMAEPGRVWGRRGKIVRVRDRSHQVRCVRYIERHAAEGAAVWRLGMGPTKKPTP